MNQTDVLNKFDVMISVLNSRVKNESKWVWFASVTKLWVLLAKIPCMDLTEEYADLVCVVDCNKSLLLHIDEVINDNVSQTDARLFTQIIHYV